MAQTGTARPTVLVVDDFDDSRFMLRRMLEMRGLRVVEAANGQEAIEAARRDCPDLILMDLNMPQVDGLMAAQQIRECKDACNNIPIIALTAFDTYGIEAAALEVGCDGYMRKPIDFDQLDGVLSRFLAGW